MRRYSFHPTKALESIIKKIEILDLPASSSFEIGNRFLPDGYFEIGFNLGSENLKITSSGSNEIQLDNPIGYFYGQGSVSSHLFFEGRTHIMIVKIFPWAASLFFDFELSDCVDCNLELSSVFGREAIFIEEQILTEGGYQNQIRILEQYLISKLLNKKKSINHLLESATKSIFQLKGDVKMKELASALNTSPRTLQRLFKQYYGITPKQFASQIRLRNFAAIVSQKNSNSFTEVALECGYFDQAHFNHEFKSITDTTPSDFFLKEIPLVDEFLKPG